MKKINPYSVLYAAAALLLCLSIVFFFQGKEWAWYGFVAGGGFYLLYHLKYAYRGDDFRLRRLNRLFAYNVVLLVASGYLMYRGNNTFMVLMLLLAVLEFYRNWRAEWYEKHPEDTDEPQKGKRK